MDTDADKSRSSSRSADIDASKGSSVDRPKSVSKANEELLNQQSKKLAKEYKDGVWAHESSITEVGGLVVRLSLEAEIYRSKDTLSIGKLLSARLERNENNGDNTSIFQETIDSNKNDDDDLSYSLIVAQTLIWYRKAQFLIEEEMKKI